MKKLRLIFCTITLCLSLGLVGFGVYSLNNQNASFTGSIEYQITDAFVDIQTKVYKSSEYLNSAQIAQYVKQLEQADFESGIDELRLHATSPVFSSSPNGDSDYVYDNFDLKFKDVDDTVYTYFFVVNIVNKTPSINVWSIMDDSAFDYVSNPYDDEIDDDSTASLEIENTVQINNGAQEYITAYGQNMVIALGLDDASKPVNIKDFNYQINIGAGDLATQDFNLNKIDIQENVVVGKGNPKGVVVIPSSFEDIDVTNIAESAFSECKMISTVIIPDTIEYIDTQAFYYCESITTLTIPYSVTDLFDYAFYGCSSLSYLEYNAINIGEDWHEGPFDAIGQYTNGGAIINIGEDVNVLPDGLFWSEEGFSNVYGVNISGNVEIIGEQAFDFSIKGLQYITVDENNGYFSDGTQYGGKNCLIDINTGKILLGSNNSVLPEDQDISIIKDYAFQNCYYLKSINIPNNIKSIGNSAFDNCEKLSSATIGSGVETIIGGNPFEACHNLTTITVNSENDNFTDGNGNCIIDKNAKTLITGCVTTVISEDKEIVTTIGAGAFRWNQILTNINIPDNITTIRDSAFVDCYNLQNVTIGKGLTTIGGSVFASCDNLSKITIKAISAPTRGSESIPTSATIYIPTGCLESYQEEWGDEYTFVELDELLEITAEGWIYQPNAGGTGIVITGYNGTEKGIVVPDELEYEGNMLPVVGFGAQSAETSVFENNTRVVGVVLPETLTTIGSNAFTDCSSLKRITIPASVTSIGNRAFYRCNNLNHITVDDDNDYYTDGDGGNCIIVKSSKTLIAGCGTTVIPTDATIVTKIAERAFYGNKVITVINIPDNITDIEGYAFGICSSLRTVTIGDGIKTIKTSVFASCESLTNLTLGDNIEKIESYAFYNCGLTSVTIGSAITTIGGNAFGVCSKLTEVTIKSTTAPTLSTNVFPASVEVIYIPTGSTESYEETWGTGYNLTEKDM